MKKFKVCFGNLVMDEYKYRRVGYNVEISNREDVLYFVSQEEGFQLWKKVKEDLIKEWGQKGFTIVEE